MTRGSGPDEPDFARTARELAGMLDEFSGLFEQALSHYRPGKDALSRHLKVDKSYISSWLRGHRQLLDPKGRRLVTSTDVEKILETTSLAEKDARLARRLRGCGTRIDTLVADLMAARPTRWRSEAGRVLRADRERAERDRTPAVREDAGDAPGPSGQEDATPQAPGTPGESRTGQVPAPAVPADTGQDPAPAVPGPAGPTPTPLGPADAGPQAADSDVDAPTGRAAASAVPESPPQASEPPADAERHATSPTVPAHGERIPAQPGSARAGQATEPSAPQPTTRPSARADAASHAVTRPVPVPAGQAPAQPGEPRTSPGVAEPGPQDTAARGDRAPSGEPGRVVPEAPRIHVLSPAAAAGTADARPGRGHRRWVFLATAVVVTAVLVAALQIARSMAAREAAGETGADTASVGRLCREWAPQPVPVEIRPCIATADGQVELWAELRAVDPADAPGEVTVWVWLMNMDRELIESRRFHLTRDQATLNSCTLTVEGDELVRCGPFRVTPPKPGEYAAAVDTRREKDILPPAWNYHTFSGTQSPPITWN